MLGLARLSLLSLMLLPSRLLLAEEATELFESTRHSGRGGGHVAAFDSDEASRFNPATLGETKIRFQLRPLELDLMIGENSINFINDISKAASSTSDTGLVKFLSSMEFGQRLYGRGQLGILSMRFGRFEVSPFMVSESAFDVHNPALPEAAWHIDAIAGMGFSYGWDLSPTIGVGMTVRPLHRWYSEGAVSMVDILDYVPPSTKDSSQLLRLYAGWGVGADLGFIWKPSKTFRMGLTALNLGDTEYFQDTGDEPPAIQQKINLGMLKRFEFGRWASDWYLDAQGIVNRGSMNLTRLLRGGTELGRPLWGRDNDIGLLLGGREGYVSYGAFADLYLVRIDLSHYTVEIGEVPGQIPDHRWALSMRSSMTF